MCAPVGNDFFDSFLLYSCGFGFPDMDIHAVDLHIIISLNENILHTADDTGLDQIAPVRSYLNGHIGGFDLDLLGINDIAGIDFCIQAEGLLKALLSLCIAICWQI